MSKVLICPRCGSEMNHQANKLVEPSTREEAESSRVLGGIVFAVFACPRCGFIAPRRDEDDSG